MVYTVEREHDEDLDASFAVLRDGTRVGRVGFVVDDTCPPLLLGRLPPQELFLVGLTVDDGDCGHRGDRRPWHIWHHRGWRAAITA